MPRLSDTSDEVVLEAERDIRAALGDRPLDFDAILAISNIYRAATAGATMLRQLLLTASTRRIVLSVKFRYPGDPLAPVRRRPAVGGLAGCVDPVGFAAGSSEGSVGFDRVVFYWVDAEEFPVL